MALNSHNFNNFSSMLTLRSGSNPTTANEALFNSSGEAVNRVGQLGLNTMLLKKPLIAKGSAWGHARIINATENMKPKVILPSAQFSRPSPTALNDVLDTQSILRTSKIIRAHLMRATSSKVSNNVVVDTEERKKAREMLQAQLLRASALARKNEVVVGGTSKPTSFDIMSAHLAIAPSPHRFNFKAQCNTHRLLNNFREPETNSDAVNKSIVLCPSPLSTYNPYHNNYMGEVIKQIENVSSNNEEDSMYDGRTHSCPYKKKGPYTCPKCNHVCETSQKFAAHVSSSHYKHESTSERKKRAMAKVRERTKNLRVQRVKEGLTIVPRDFVASDVDAGNINNNNNNVVNAVPRPPVMIKLESVEVAEGVRGVKYALAPPPGMELIPGAGVKIKLEPMDA